MRTDLDDLHSLLDVRIEDDLLVVALTHRSFAYVNGGLPTNERLEFLGDAVLGLVVTETLYGNYPDCSEGQLAKMRAAVVNANALAEVARTIGLGEYVRLGRGEDATGGRDKSSILADTLEAVLGAVFSTAGVDQARVLVHRLFDPLIDRASELGAGLDWKTSLQEIAASAGLGLPEYRVSETGPDHAKEFTATVVLSGDGLGHGVGRSKKIAEQQAAAQAYRRIAADRPDLAGGSG
jgi:ribonuclease-3